MNKYEKMTNEEFDALLGEIMNESPASHLMSVPGVYEVVAEEFNNEVLDRWSAQQNAEPMSAEEDLKAKVSTILKELHDFGMEKLDKLIRSGSGVVEDHERNERNYVTAKLFMVAFAKEIEHQYKPLVEVKEKMKIAENYYCLM